MRLPGSARGLATLTGLHLVLWCAAHAPALGPRWWFLDDYTLADVLSRGNVGHHLGQGRQGQLLWMLTFYVDAVDGRGAGSLPCRERCRAEPRSATFRLFAVPVGPTLCVCPP